MIKINSFEEVLKSKTLRIIFALNALQCVKTSQVSYLKLLLITKLIQKLLKSFLNKIVYKCFIKVLAGAEKYFNNSNHYWFAY